MGMHDHILGIGGVGMSALAQALLDQGRVVSGSDRLLDAGGMTPVLKALARQGVAFLPETCAGLSADTARLVVTTAIEETHPALARARDLAIPVVHRAKALSEAFAARKLVGVVGTCGKSTVTAILGHLLTVCGFDPMVVNGAQIVGWDQGGSRVGSTRTGAGPWAVAEVDESDRSLTAFRPFAALVTNASADHYSEAEMHAVFDAFVQDVPGPVVDGRKLLKEGRGEGPLWTLAAAVPLPGLHNRANAFLALSMARALGAREEALAAALATFPGVERRLQRIGSCQGAAVFDDYAHNPEKLAAMWRTLAEAYPKGVAVLWRPHGFAPLRKMMEGLVAAFGAVKRPQDGLFILPVYDAGGTADRSVNADQLAARLPGAEYVKDLHEAERVLRERAPAFGAMVTAGARDPGLPVLARRLAGKE